MPALPRPNLDVMPDSPYAAQLRLGGMRRFAPDLEREYQSARLFERRVLIRAAALLALLVATFRGVENVMRGFPSYASPVLLAVMLLLSSGLAYIACSAWFARWYLPAARIAIPLRNAIAAIPIAGSAAHGQAELLMVMSFMVIGPFFFSGLSFRAALLTVLATAASFVLSAWAFQVAAPVAAHTCVFMVTAVVGGAVAAWHFDKRSRASFLEGHLMGELAEHDALTGTKNRRVFDEHLGRIWQQAAEDGRAIAILLIDVDHFKSYNDRYGHQAGDVALRRTAKALQSFVTRPLDLLARYGGEEFAAILYDVGGREAEGMAEEMGRAVRELAIEHRGGTAPVVTISVGVAAIEPTPERTARGALQLADEALYKAKVRGRNCVEVRNGDDYSHLVTGVFAKISFARGA
jgi:diguanylate cyclase (GGDEF)-like protein